MGVAGPRLEPGFELGETRIETCPETGLTGSGIGFDEVIVDMATIIEGGVGRLATVGLLLPELKSSLVKSSPSKSSSLVKILDKSPLASQTKLSGIMIFRLGISEGRNPWNGSSITGPRDVLAAAETFEGRGVIVELGMLVLAFLGGGICSSFSSELLSSSRRSSMEPVTGTPGKSMM